MSTTTGPTTEQPNPLTADLDVSSPSTILSLLGQVDVAVLDPPLLSLPAKRPVVLVGCGTSGRLAYLVSQSHSTAERPVTYAIAGGDTALFAAKEAFEDRPAAGAADTRAAIEAFSKDFPLVSDWVVIGITCGMSAPYVAGSLDWAMDNGCEVVLLGFNSIENARVDPMHGYGTRTFRDVALRVSSVGKVVNPLVGPEAVTGSSRMKGGSMTKFIIEGALTNGAVRGSVYRDAHEAVYGVPRSSAQLSLLGSTAGQALLAGSCVVYLAREAVGILSLIDASEQRPTFGAAETDVRGFVIDPSAKWSAMASSATDSPVHMNTMAHFESSVLATLPRGSLVILVVTDMDGEDSREADCARVKELLPRLREAGAKLWTVAVGIESGYDVSDHLGDRVDGSVHIDIPLAPGPAGSAVGEACCKWVFNFVSTCAHVLKGVVYKNRMINLCVSNQKLYLRAVNIVSTVAQVPAQDAETALLEAIYSQPPAGAPARPARDADLAEAIPIHLANAQGRTGIVPLAVLLAADKTLTVDQAAERIKAEPRIRLAIEKFCGKKE
jgi:N-acetylmuramic acid 6-phosphate (MurNAc-6-P) etherase